MNLYLIEQSINTGYDTYDSAVVAAESPEDARTIKPSGSQGDEYTLDNKGDVFSTWVTIDKMDKIDVTFLGHTELKRGVILASFNAG